MMALADYWPAIVKFHLNMAKRPFIQDALRAWERDRLRKANESRQGLIGKTQTLV